MSNLDLPVTQAPSGYWRSALVGVIFGADAAAHCLALATICFTGALAGGLGAATGLFLLGTAAATLTLFLFGRIPRAVGISQDTTISILAPAILLATSAVAGTNDAKVATAFAVIGTSALLSGVTFWIIGRLGLGRLVRMFPFPVAAGFLASSGYLLVFAALTIVTHQNGLAAIWTAASDPLVQLRLIPALFMAVLLTLAVRYIKGTMPVVVIIFAALIGYHLIASATGLDATQAAAMGLIPDISATSGGSFSAASLFLIDWAAVASVAPVIAAVVLLNLLGILLNLSGVELATRGDVDENHELRITGLVNLGIGLTGGLTAYLQGGASIMMAKLGVHQRGVIAGYIPMVVLAAFLAPVLVNSVPVFIPAALLMFIGWAMLSDWLFATAKRLTFIDALTVLAIVLATAIVGILPAIGIGLALAVTAFAYASIRMPIIRQSNSVATRQSIRDRSVLHRDALRQEGDRICILHLQGPLFFGSVERLISHLRMVTTQNPRVEAVIIDFSEVLTFDSSACSALDKLSNLLQSHGISAHLTGVTAGLQAVFTKWGLPITVFGQPISGPQFLLWSGLDEAIEHCENQLLGKLGLRSEESDVAQVLFELGRQHPRTVDLIAKMQRIVLAKGDVLIKAADMSGDVFFVTTGRLGVHLPNAPGKSLRVRVLGPGAIVGEIAHMSGRPRNAEVICEEASTVLCLSAENMRQIEAEDRDLAALMMSIFNRSLASKLEATNGLLTYAQTMVPA
ncbi:MAG: hypothetical protein RIR95_618 [Pseudomonadota bacterium]